VLVTSMLGPVAFVDLRGRAGSLAGAADLVPDLLSTWLEGRAARLRP
jgi:hypothetical protein